VVMWLDVGSHACYVSSPCLKPSLGAHSLCACCQANPGSAWRRGDDRENLSQRHTSIMLSLSAELRLVPLQNLKDVFECAVTDTRKSYTLRGKRRAIGALHTGTFSRVRQYLPFGFNPYWDPYATGSVFIQFPPCIALIYSRSICKSMVAQIALEVSRRIWRNSWYRGEMRTA